MLPVVALVGRPNVGKSTLFNRLLGQRKAIVEDFPGVTRDRHYAEVSRFGRPFLLIDTGGFEPASEDRLLTQMREQSQLAVGEADIIFFLMDVRDGLTASDEEVSKMLRKIDKPVFYIVNKVDGDKQEIGASEFYALGIEKVYSVSAEHGRGVNDLVEDLSELLPPAAEKAEQEDEVRMAVIGRPNVGKSSLVNKLLGFERVVANPTSGTTRDSIDTPFEHDGKRYVLIDTAGIRRKGKVSQKLEKYSAVNALKAMDRAHVVLMVIDAEEGGLAACGLINIVPRLPRPGRKSHEAAYIQWVSTAPQHHRKGYARAIMRDLLAETDRREIEVVELHATVLGQSLYKEFGFFVKTDNIAMMVLRGDAARDAPLGSHG